MDIYSHFSKYKINQHYLNRYIKLIEYCKHQIIGGYSENHHILPSSIFPEYSSFKDFGWNKCTMSARCHFIAHYLLAKMFISKEKYSMINAFMMMKANSTNRRYLNSKLYENLRTKFSECISYHQSGEGNSQFGTVWINDGTQDKKIPKEQALEDGWVYGRKRNPKKKKDESVKQNIARLKAIEWYNIFLESECDNLTDFIEKVNYPYSKPNLVNSWKRHVPEYIITYDRKAKRPTQ